MDERLLKTQLNIIEIYLVSIIISLFLVNNIFYFTLNSDNEFKIFAFLSILSSGFSALLIYSSNKIYTLGFFSVLFIYFTMTHFGASTVFLLSPTTIFDKFEPHQYQWLYSQNVIKALYLCINAQIVYIIIGYLFSSIKNNKRNVNVIKSVWLPKIGILLVAFILFYFSYNILIGNISLTSSYSAFTEWKSNSVFISWALFLLATGYILTLATGSKKQIITVNMIYAMTGIILFLTGNKGEVLYAALVGLGVYYSRFGKVSKKIILLFLFLFFIVVPFITSTRWDSVIGSINQLGVNFVEPFIETGWQLRTVEAVVSWQESGQSIGWGVSYFIPLQRLFSNLTMGVIPPLPLLGEAWSFGERLPGWGFSQVAESYYNFNLVGPIIFHALIGWFAVKVDNTKSNLYRKGFYASIGVILMILTRNRFSFVPGQITLAFIIILIAFVLDSYQKNNLDLRRLRKW